MKLDAYMKANGLSDFQMAEKLNRSRGAVVKWRRGERMPRPGELRRITQYTEGAVTANDFFDGVPQNEPHSHV